MKYRKQRKYLIVFMVFLLFFSIIPTPYGLAESNSSSQKKLESSEENPQNISNISIEDIRSSSKNLNKPVEEIALRKENEKVINNQDGTFTKRIFDQPVHFKKGDKWEEISLDLIEKNGNEYKPKNTELDVSFQKNMKDGQYAQFQQDNHIFSVKLIQADGEQGVIKVQPIVSTVSGNKIWYKQIFPNIDLRNIIFNDSVKEDIVLHQYTGHNQFQFEISTELKPHTKEDGSITFVDEQDKEIYILPKPFMSDSNINPESGEAATSENVSYDLKEEEDGKYLLTLIADSEWLKSPERKFPIYIDPTVTNEHYNNFVYAYVSNAYPNNNYSNSKLWDATYEAYVLKVGYYDSTTGDNYAYLKNSLVNLQGAVIKKATLWLYTIWSYSTTPTNVWVSTSKTDWNPSTITWNYSPSVANLGTATAVRNSWFSYDVTTTVQNWANNPSGNFGFSLHTSGNGATYWKKFIAYDNKNRLPEIEITYTFLDKPAKPTVIPYPLATNSSTGYFDLSWSKVEGADYYLIGIWNGKKYDYINVGNVNSWSTKGKKIWPTVAQIEQGRYWLHTESSPSGTDLPNDPNSTYVASQGDWQSSHQYWFVVSACSSISGYCSPNSDWSERYLPDTTAPNQPGQIGVKITDGANNSGSTAKADLSWNSVSDLPTTIGTGIDYYEIQKYTEGSWKPVANVPHLGAAGYSYSVTNLPDSSSNIMFRIKAFDKSKNYSGFSTSSEYVTKDRTKPKTPTDLKINPEKWTNSQEFTLSWEGITDNKQINTIQYSIDDGEWIPLGTNVSTGSKTIKNEALSDGIHEIKVRGIDAEGNYGDSKSVSLKKDTLAPTIVFNYPDNAQTIGGIVDINAKINVDKAPVSYWKLEVGEGESPSTFEIKNSGTELASDNILYSWDTTKLNEQTTYTIKIEVQDEAGNINRVTRKVIKSKNTETINPAINILAPTNQETITKPLYPVEYLIDNVSPNTGDYEANLFVNSKLVNSTGKDKIGLTLDATQYAEGSSNKFYIRGKDSLGNYKFSTTSYQTKGVVDTFEYLENIEKLQGISHAAHSLQLNSTSNGYSLEGSFESKVQPFAGDIQTIYLKPVEQKPAGTDISYFASADGGQTWQSIKPFQTEAFQQVGNSLKVKAILTTTSGNITPILNSWDSDIVYVNTDDTFKVKLIDEPKKLTATPNVNYMTLLRWKASETSGVTYNMYRSTTESFTPSEDTLLAEGIQTSYWNDYNLNYGQKFYYKVVAIKDFNGKKRLSLSSNVAWSKVVDKDELEKRMGLQDYWGYSTLRTGGGDGYINMSSGNLVYQSTDFVAAGPKLGMVMKRSYNSQSTTKTPLGYGWDFSFNTTLLKEYNEAGQEVGLILKDGDGSLHRFGKNKTGTYDSPKGVHMILTRKADGTYEILRKDQIKYVFDINLKLTNFTEPNGNQLTLTYDPDRGNLSSVKNNVGDEIRFTYFSDENLNDHLKYVIDQAGRVYNFRYNDKGHLEQVHQIIENNAEYAETYQYDPSDKLRFINDPKSHKTTLDYENGKLFKVTDPVEEYYYFKYDPNQTTVTSDKGKTISFTFNQDGNITSKTNTLGHQVHFEYNDKMLVEHMYYDNEIDGTIKTLHYHYTYDARGNILTSKDPLGNITEFKNYNDMNQVKDIIKPISNGVLATYHYDYDDYGNLRTSMDPEGRTVSYTHDSFGNQKTITNEFNQITSFDYDQKGRLKKKTEPLGKITEILEYDKQGNPTKVKDARGYITSTEYDLLGRLFKTTYPDGYTETRKYDFNHNMVEYKNRRGFETSYKYDNVDRLLETIHPNKDIEKISYQYDPENNEKIVYTDAEGRQAIEYYDAVGRLKQVEKNKTITSYKYDSVGNMIEVIDGEGRQVQSKYDELNRQTKMIIDPNGKNIVSQNIYDLDGNILTSINGEGFSTINQYDKLGRLETVTQNVEGKNVVTSYLYDQVEGDYVKNIVTDAEGRAKVTYLDALGRVAKEVAEGTPSNRVKFTESFEYDLNGNMKVMTRNDGTKEVHDYNPINLLEKVTFSPDHETTFEYDENGNRKKMTDKKGTQTIVTSYALDSKDRMTSYVQDGHSVSYQYDGSDNVKRIYYRSEEGDLEKDIDYVYDSYNRLHSIKVEGKTAQEYVYTNSGQVDYIKNYRQFDTGGLGYVKIDYGYNTAGLTESIQYLDNGDKKLEEYTMQYDRRGFITNEDLYTNYDTAKTIKKSYQYDEAGRLKTSNQDDKTTAYTYDGVGNRLTMTEGADKFVYTYNPLNQLKTKTKNGLPDSSYEFDDRGNQTKEITKRKIDGVLKDVTSSFTYDLANRLEKVDQTISGEKPVVEQNFYNGDGQRIRRDVNGLISKYFYDGENVLYTTDINNNKATENVLSPSGTIVASKRFDGAFDNMYFFYHYDKRGSVTSILDPDAKRVIGYGYDEFGETEEVGSKSFLNEVKFTGAVHDTATGLYYMNARHYNPDTGRFISQDTYKGTASDPWSQHLYAYTSNNPVNFIDPTGHLPIYEDENGYVRKASPYDIPKSSWPGNRDVPYTKSSSKNTQSFEHPEYDTGGALSVPWHEDPIFNTVLMFSGIGELLAVRAELLSAQGILNQSISFAGKNAAKGTGNFVKVNNKTIINTATSPKKGGETVVGHALQKHAGRNPDIWGKVKGGPNQINQTALKHLEEIIGGPGGFIKIKNPRGIEFLEKKLPDGRGVRLNLDGTFKGFIDQQ